MFHNRKHDRISLAIDAHGSWRLALRRAITTGKMGKSVQNVADSHACILGAWLHGPEIDAAIRDTPAFRLIDRLHDEFHQASGEIAQLVEHGRLAEAEALLAGDWLAKSNCLLEALENWRGELGPARGAR
ncbi:CZB domain-containing protein [Phaeovulum sp.]|uniref:CZB domain-containing protein n=1 Tax=Phaeovulum sp. TaxID=2934796 RepID=UPI0035639A68